MSTVLKWLTATLLAALALLLVVLALGYMLKKNARETTALVEQIAQKTASTSGASTQKTAKIYRDRKSQNDEVHIEIAPLKTLIKDNLICTSSEQCQILQVPNALGCFVAVNNIGFIKLTQHLKKHSSRIDMNEQCFGDINNYLAHCEDNFCTLAVKASKQ